MNISRLASTVLVLSACVTIPAVLLLLLVFYEILIAPPVIVYTNVPFPVQTASLHPGQALTLTVSRCANDPLAPDPVVYTFTRTLVEVNTNIRTGIPDGGSETSHGCQIGFQSAINIIPDNLPSGRYYLEGTSSAYGRFKASVVKWHTEEFQVLNDE